MAPQTTAPARATVGKTDRYRAAVTATLVALPLAVLTGLGMFWWSGGFAADTEPAAVASGPVEVDLSAPGGPAPVDPDAETICRALLANLPVTLDEHTSRPVTPASASERAAAWGDPAIVLRCGVGRPPTTANNPDQSLTTDGVTWLVTETEEQTTLRVADRRVAVDVRIPTEGREGSFGSVLRALAAPIVKSVPPAR